LSRSTSDLSSTEGFSGVQVGMIDNYYYYSTHAQATCADNGTDIQTRDLVVINNLLAGIEKI